MHNNYQKFDDYIRFDSSKSNRLYLLELGTTKQANLV